VSIWLLPDGTTLVARIYESYLGLRGQARVGLVDSMGRVYHFNLSDIEEVTGG
jgi:hypothetical protein